MSNRLGFVSFDKFGDQERFLTLGRKRELKLKSLPPRVETIAICISANLAFFCFKSSASLEGLYFHGGIVIKLELKCPMLKWMKNLNSSHSSCSMVGTERDCSYLKDSSNFL